MLICLLDNFSVKLELGWVRLGEVQRPDLLRLLIAMA